MKKEGHNLDRLKGVNPFTIPDGYMEGLTERIMSQLPDKPAVVEKPVSLMDRVRPWLYLAAVFAGLGLFFKAIVGEDASKNALPDSLLVRTEIPAEALNVIDEITEDEEYLEYLEAQCAHHFINEELADSE